MGKTFYDLTDEELCDLMCGDPEEDYEDDEETEDEETCLYGQLFHQK